jgi:hypothetical protein
VGESLPTQEVQYRFINEACATSSVPSALYTSFDVALGDGYNYSIEKSIQYNPGTEVTFTTPTDTGYHYMFISIPAGRSFIIKDTLDNVLTNLFLYYSEDISREGFAQNTLYRYEEPFGASDPVTFKITLN